MTQPPSSRIAPIREDQVPSLGIVEDALKHEDESYRVRANSLDTKAGVILSAAGVIVALVGTNASIAGLIAQIAAIASGIAAVLTILPRVDKAIGPRNLRDRYLQMDPVTTRLFMLNTRTPCMSATSNDSWRRQSDSRSPLGSCSRQRRPSPSAVSLTRSGTERPR